MCWSETEKSGFRKSCSFIILERSASPLPAIKPAQLCVTSVGTTVACFPHIYTDTNRRHGLMRISDKALLFLIPILFSLQVRESGRSGFCKFVTWNTSFSTNQFLLQLHANTDISALFFSSPPSSFGFEAVMVNMLFWTHVLTQTA